MTRLFLAGLALAGFAIAGSAQTPMPGTATGTVTGGVGVPGVIGTSAFGTGTAPGLVPAALAGGMQPGMGVTNAGYSNGMNYGSQPGYYGGMQQGYNGGVMQTNYASPVGYPGMSYPAAGHSASPYPSMGYAGGGECAPSYAAAPQAVSYVAADCGKRKKRGLFRR